MAVQTYCTYTEVEVILSEHGVTAFLDDELESDVRSTSETTVVNALIERAAEMVINFRLCHRYKLPS